MKKLLYIFQKSKFPVLLILFTHLNCFAQGQGGRLFEKYFQHIWQSEQGLPHNAGRFFAQTCDGYLWIGCQDGLVRYNGREFTVFTKYNTPELKHNDITALLLTRDSSLWIGTFNGLTSYKNGKFTYHSANAGFDKEVIRALAADHEGNIWIGTMNAGIQKYRDGEFKFLTTAEGLSHNSINGIAEDFQGNLWVSTLTGISVFGKGKWTNYKYNKNIANNSGQDILVARDSSVWIGSTSGLMRWKNNSFRTYTMADGLTDDVIRAIYEDRSGAIWIGTERGGVCCLRDGSFSSFRATDGLTSDFVDAIFEDREENFWIGTYTEGINQFIKSKFMNYSVKNGLPQGTIRTLIQTRDGMVWIGTEGSGLVRFDGKGFFVLNTKGGLPNDFIRSLLEDSRGNLWIGTRNGLARYRKGKVRNYSERDGLKHTFIRAIAEDKDGFLWVGTVNDGVYRLINDKFVNYRSNGIPMNDIRSVLVDHNNTIWISGNEAVMRWHEGKVSTLTPKDGLPVEPIYTIYEDSSHIMWLGSNGGGLVRIKNESITRYTYAEGLSDDVVHVILEDDLHNLWMSCNGGIFKVSKQSLTDFAEKRTQRIYCTFYDAADGMISNEVSGNSQPSGWKTSDGRLWFPALRGVVVVDPLNLQENTSPPPLVIERAILNSMDQEIPQDGLIAPPGAGRIEIYYSALTFISSNKVEYRIKLEGFDNDWIYAGSRTRATYTNLPPGRYVFHVVACNNDGVWNETGAKLAFELSPYYYQTTWFYGIAAIVLIGIMFGAYQWHTWRYVKRERELKRRVEEALAEIKILGGLIPICSNCKKIRDDKGFWDQLEHYINVHSEATFTHSICPECAEKLYPEIYKNNTGG